MVQSLNPISSFSISACPGWTASRPSSAGGGHVVFVTPDEYAISAFEQGAVDYLLAGGAGGRNLPAPARGSSKAGSTNELLAQPVATTGPAA
jgi:hypothetical protein